MRGRIGIGFVLVVGLIGLLLSALSRVVTRVPDPTTAAPPLATELAVAPAPSDFALRSGRSTPPAAARHPSTSGAARGCAPADRRLRLVATLVATTSSRSAAVFEVRGFAEPFTVSPGDRLPRDLGTVESIAHRRAVVNASPGCRLYTLAGVTPAPSPGAPSATSALPGRLHAVIGAGIRALSATSFVVRRESLEEALGQFARLSPSIHGRLDAGGLRIKRVDRGSIFRKLGLQPGDRIVQINGAPLDGYEAAVELYERLRHASTIRLGVVRGGERTMLSYDIDG